MLPWLANLATIVAIAGATWWSSEHRPSAGLPETSAAAPERQIPAPAGQQATAANPGLVLWSDPSASPQADSVKTMGLTAIR